VRDCPLAFRDFMVCYCHFLNQIIKMPNHSKSAQKQRNHPKRGGKPRKANASRSNLLSFSDNFSFQQRQLSPFPPKMTRDMMWALSFNVASPASQGVFGTQHTFKLNSLNQPDGPPSSGTHKPYAWVEMSAIYDRYIVHATRAEMIFQVSSGSKAMALGFSVIPSASSYSITGEAVPSVLENQMGSIVWCNATGWTTTKKFTLPIHMIEGLAKAVYDAELDDYSGSTQSGNPSKTPTLNIALSNQTDGTSVNLSIILKLMFRATFYSRTVQAPD